ncbi:diaminobutyrate acetyltransferase [Catenovulum sediminis]|uniref:L-2,4-diaminobutyric acid acetyltransferase n=1 Tax=Catenovulum sediminis TaxID=1740262 RepID=A0ABV1RHF9_9ALTE|nr:diaminobutyrate acetyltransferase [Catenovulum sediminis]
MDKNDSMKGQPEFRCPKAEDGYPVHQLIAACPPLDTNSAYCNLLQCSHFAETCVIAEIDGDIVGWVSAYIEPTQPDTLFIWQMAVSEKARGYSLARKMLEHLLAREVCSKVCYIETTITADNAASRRVFKRLAENLGTQIVESEFFTKEKHFGGQHSDEFLFRIGPFSVNTQIKTNEE